MNKVPKHWSRINVELIDLNKYTVNLIVPIYRTLSGSFFSMNRVRLHYGELSNCIFGIRINFALHNIGECISISLGEYV